MLVAFGTGIVKIPGDYAGGIVIQLGVELFQRKAEEVLIGLQGIVRVLGAPPDTPDGVHPVAGGPGAGDEIAGITHVFMKDVPVGIGGETGLGIRKLPFGEGLLRHHHRCLHGRLPGAEAVVGHALAQLVAVHLVLEAVANLVRHHEMVRTGVRVHPEGAYPAVEAPSFGLPGFLVVEENHHLVLVQIGFSLADGGKAQRARIGGETALQEVQDAFHVHGDLTAAGVIAVALHVAAAVRLLVSEALAPEEDEMLALDAPAEVPFLVPVQETV